MSGEVAPGFASIYRTLGEVAQERHRQEARWGEQNHGDERWQGILGEEMGEVCKATNETWADEKFSLEHEHQLRTELIQVAAVAVAWVEAIDRRVR